MAGYLGASPVPQTIQKKQSFTATASQTTFTTTGYTDGQFINVYLNGVRLINGTDYTATNGSDIVLTSAASASDVLDFETFNEFTLVDQDLTTPTLTGATLKSNVTLKNDTEEDTDGGRESTLIFKGEQSGGEISTLAEIEASHDGASDDEKGDLIFRTNDGNDGASPTERLRINSAGDMLFSSDDPSLTIANTTHEDTDGGRESTIVFQGEQSGGEVSTLAQIEAAHDGTGDDEKGDLIFRTNDGSDGSSPTAAVIIDSAQNVGLGQNPVGYSNLMSALQIGGNANIISEKTGSASNSLIISQNANYDTDNSWEYMVTDEASGYYQTGGEHVFRRAASGTAGTDITWTEMARINQYGLTFNGDTSQINALDDYEEGTWTPTAQGTGGSTGQSYSSATGTYVKVGRLVNIWFTFTLSAEGTHSGSELQLYGLPFTQTSGSGVAGGSINFASGLGVNVLGSLTLNAQGGTTKLYLNYADNDSTSPITNSVSLLTNTSRFDGFATYISAS